MSNLISGVAAVFRRVDPLRGRGRLAQLLHRRLRHRRVAVGDQRTPMLRGHEIVSPWSSAHTWEAALTGRWDDAEHDFLAEWIEPGSFVVDVGACFGWYAIPLAKLGAGRDAVVAAFEPIPTNRAYLEQNIRLNDLDNVEVLPFALGSAEGTSHVAIEDGRVGNAAIAVPTVVERRVYEPFGTPDVEADIPIKCLDSVEWPDSVASRRCSVMKLDVEGYEMEVLIGAEEFVSRHRPLILGEFHSAWMELRGWSNDSVRRWSEDHDYELLAVSHRRSNPMSDRKTVVPVQLVDDPRRGALPLLLIPRGA